MPFLKDYQKKLVAKLLPGADTEKYYTLQEYKSLLAALGARSRKASSQARLRLIDKKGLLPGVRVKIVGCCPDIPPDQQTWPISRINTKSGHVWLKGHGGNFNPICLELADE